MDKLDANGAFRTVGGKPIFWDNDGVTHRCEGADVRPGIRLIWTDCQHDVPAGRAYACGDGSATVDCPECIARFNPKLLGVV